MKEQFKSLGKVCLTPEGIWDRTKAYSEISIVTNKFDEKTYISRKFVPVGIEITNDEYWQKIGSAGYKNNNIIIISDVDISTGELTQYTLEEAINKINVEDRTPGLIIGFYGTTNTNDGTPNWSMYQYIKDTINDWNNLDSWTSVYNNMNKFKGYYTDEYYLNLYHKNPNIGDYAYIGNELATSYVYRCINKGQWINSKEYVKQFLSIIFGGNITIGKNGNWYQNGIDTGIEAKGPKGNVPYLRVLPNNDFIEVSIDNGIHWQKLFDISKAMPIIQVGNTTTIPTGNKAKVTKRVDGKNAIFDFEIPQGDVGSGLKILGHVNEFSNLPMNAKTGDAYLVGTNKPYSVYIFVEGIFKDCGLITNANSYVRVVQELGNSTEDTISQDVITKELNAKQLQIDNILSGITGVTFNITPEIFFVNNSTKISLTVNINGAKGIISIFKNGNLLIKTDTAKNTLSITDITDIAMEYKAIVSIDNKVITKTAIVKTVYPMYVGVGNIYTDIINNKFIQTPRTSVKGEYPLETNKGDKIFLVIPENMILSEVYLGMMNLPYKLESTKNIYGIKYNIYASLEKFSKYKFIILLK